MKHFCERCDKEFKPTRGKQRFCSRHCSDLAFRGPNHPRYKGGSTRKDGYHIIQVDGKSMLEHRYIMEQHLDRKLGPNETVHHIDGNPSNNMIANLLIMSNRSEHTKSHCARYRTDTHKQCSCCHEIKPRSEFFAYGNAHENWDPHRSDCKQCCLEKDKARKSRHTK